MARSREILNNTIGRRVRLSKAYFGGRTSPNFATQNLAERVGVEPTIPLLAGYTISNRAPSASRASLL